MSKTNTMAGANPLATEKIGHLIIKYSIPAIISGLVSAIYNMVDQIFLGWGVGDLGMAATNVAFPFTTICMAMALLFGIGGASNMSLSLGKGDRERSRNIAGNTLLLLLISGTLMALVSLAFLEPLLTLFGATAPIMPYAKPYTLITAAGMPFLIFSMMSNNLLRAEGRPLLSMYVVLTASITSAVLDPFLIFGFWIFPQMGIKGAAVASLCAQFISFLFSVNFLCLKSSKYELSRKYFRPNLSIINSIFSTGFPSIISHLIISLVLIVYNHVLAQYGSPAIAALGICFRVNGLVMMILFGIGFGLMPIVGYSHGAGLYQRLRQAVFAAIKASVSVAVFSTIILTIFADFIVAVFSNDPVLTAIAVPALRIYVLLLLFLAPTLVFINMFLGLGKGALTMFIFLFRDTVLLIPLLLFLSRFAGITGVWMAMPIANFFTFFLTFYYARREIKKFKSWERNRQIP